MEEQRSNGDHLSRIAPNLAKSQQVQIRDMTQVILGPDLCTVCQKISLESLLAPEGFAHVSDPSMLRIESSTKPCPMCSLIYHSVADVFSYRINRHWEDSSSRDRFIIFGSNLDRSIPPGTFLIGRLDVSAEAEDPAAEFIPRRRLPRDPGLEDGMFMAAQLFNECIHTHPECKKPQITLLPTRILCVGSTDNSKVFLVVSGGRADRYAVLSYCWGGSQDFTATEDTWEVLTTGIALSTLPNTIQDAVIVTRRLGLQYLVIENGDYLWYATMTIAAAGASNCNVGCFIQDVSAENHMLETLPPRLPDQSSGTFSVCVQNYYTPEVDPLNKRAWALQERLLSLRVLIYTVGNMSWQCQTKTKPYGVGSTRLPDFLFKTKLADPLGTLEWSQPVPEEEWTTLETSWMSITLDYSRRALTYGEDKLPALSGLASIFQELTGDVYLAGLWKKTVRQGLLWCIGMPIKSLPLAYHVPTCSWLSVEMPILYRRARTAFHVEVLEAEMTLVGPDRTGAISSGTIKLCGQMKQARHEKDDSLWGMSLEEPVRAGSVIPDLEWEVNNAIDGPLWCLRIAEDEDCY